MEEAPLPGDVDHWRCGVIPAAIGCRLSDGPDELGLALPLLVHVHPLVCGVDEFLERDGAAGRKCGKSDREADLIPASGSCGVGELSRASTPHAPRIQLETTQQEDAELSARRPPPSGHGDGGSMGG